MRRKRCHGLGSLAKTAEGNWRFQYRGKSKTVKSKNYPSRREAERELRNWIDELDKTANGGEPTTMSLLFDRFLARHRRDGLAETYIVEKKIKKYLRPRLGHYNAATFGLSEIDQYVDERKAEKTSKGTLTRNGTINRELAIVVSSLRLMRPEPRVLHIKKLNEEDGVRQGIVSEEDYRVFLRELEGYQKPVWCFAYYVGVRQGQLLKLRREWAREWQATGIICVPGRYKGERITKNAKPHHIPIYSAEMREFLKIAWETGDPACSYLFQRDGKRISKNMFYSALKRIAIRIGRPTILFHDLRRTAVTNMIRAGIPPEEAMAVSGHLDPSIFKRYNIISTAESQDKVRRAGQKMAAWHEKKQKEVTDLADIMRTESDFDAPDSEIARKPN